MRPDHQCQKYRYHDADGPSREAIAALVKADRVHTSLYTSDELFQLELERIFSKTWVWVAHVSEIPETGSFKTTEIGTQPVIVVRDRKGTLHTLLNRCRHRAATVCEHRSGKTNSFVCPYHGWGYALDGSLRGVPHPESYADRLEKNELGLVSLRTEQYAGMVFATFNEQIEPLEDFLGAAKKWMDLFMKQGAGYPIKTGMHTASASRATGKFSWRTPPTAITSRWCTVLS